MVKMEATLQLSQAVANQLQTALLTLSTSQKLMLEVSSLTEVAPWQVYQSLTAMVHNIIQVSCPWVKMVTTLPPIPTPQQQDSTIQSKGHKHNLQTIWETLRRASCKTSRIIVLRSRLDNKCFRITFCSQNKALTIKVTGWWRPSTILSSRQAAHQEDMPALLLHLQEAVASPISSQDKVETATDAVSTICETNW